MYQTGDTIQKTLDEILRSCFKIIVSPETEVKN